MESIQLYRKNPSVVTTELDDGAILLNLETKYYYNLNVTGLKFWQTLETNPNPLTIAQIIAKEFDANEERVKNSIMRLVNELNEEGLILKN